MKAAAMLASLADSCAGINTNATTCVHVIQNPWPVLITCAVGLLIVGWFALH